MFDYRSKLDDYRESIENMQGDELLFWIDFFKRFKRIEHIDSEYYPFAVCVISDLTEEIVKRYCLYHAANNSEVTSHV